MRGKYDTEVADLAGRQHGVVARAQLLSLGVGEHAIDRRLSAGRLHPIHRGVYAVGHRVLTREGRWMAAVLACGNGATLSHATAAAGWDLRTNEGLIHVTVRGSRKAPRGVKLHRSAMLTSHEITTVRGIPVTTPARTIIDLARTMGADDLERIVDEADRRRLLDFAGLRATHPASLKAALRRYDPAPTRSELEARFTRLCDDHGIERPETNVRIEGIEVDFVWRDRRLIVEVDGYRYHRAPSQFERDRERDVRLAMAGWRVLRFTWRQVTERGRWVAAAIG
jgi:very-short-patch-repair endonuclease